MVYEAEATYSSFPKCFCVHHHVVFPSVNPMILKKPTKTMTKTLDYYVSNIWVYGRQYHVVGGEHKNTSEMKST